MHKFLLVFSMLLPSAHADYFSPELAASAGAKFANHSGTIRNFIDRLSPILTVEEKAGVEKFFSELKVDLNSKIPQFTANGVYLNFGSDRLKFNKNRTFEFRGQIYQGYKKDPGTLDGFLRKFRQQFDKAVACYDFLIPCANAFDVNKFAQWLPIFGAGNAAAMASTDVGVPYDPRQSLPDKSAKAPLSKLVFTCDGKGKEIGIADPVGVLPVDQQMVYQVLGRKITSCNPIVVAEFQKAYDLGSENSTGPKSTDLPPSSR